MTAPSEAAELIRCTGLSRTYGSGSVPAVREASCTLRAGMQVALTGPSGSGKSTLLHLMAGLDTPTSGTIAWPGLDGSPFARPGVVGLVFQGPSLLPPLDVTENIALPLLLAGYAETQARERAGAALHQVGLDELAAVAARADEDLLAQPARLLEYLVDHMLAGHEQDDDVTVLVMHRPSGGSR